jgi:hypothetical protein
VELVTAIVDIDDVRSARASIPSRAAQAAIARSFPVISVDDLRLEIPEEESYACIPVSLRKQTNSSPLE